MHICLNVTGSTTWMGGVIYTQNLARAIASLPKAERARIKLSVSVDADSQNFVDPVRECFDQVYPRAFFQKAYLKLCKILAERVPVVPLGLLNPDSVDFVYPTIAGTRSPYQWGGWIPDFQSYHLPELFSKEEILFRQQWHQAVARSAPVIVLSSATAQQDLKQFYPEAGDRSQVMNFASSFEADWFEQDPKAVQAKYELPDRFFLVSNQFWKHKDHAVIAEALSVLKDRGIEPTIVCTGKTADPRNPEYFTQLSEKIESLGVQHQMRIVGLIPRIDQIQLMRRCLAVIQPSRFEGWSTVVEDARTLGKPVILSDFPVHIEQNPPNSFFFEQGNAYQLADLIAKATSLFDPGPVPEEELRAREDNASRVQAFGLRFLEIASSVTNK